MNSTILLIGFMGLFTCSFNIKTMGGPGATITDFPEVQEKEVPYLPPELQEVIIIKTLDSILKEPLPREQAALNDFVSRYLELLPNPSLSNRNRKYFLNRLAHKFFLTFGKHLKVPDWYLIKYFGEPGKKYNRYEKTTLREKVLDYSFSLQELLSHNLFNRKMRDFSLNLSSLRLNNLNGLLKIPRIKEVITLYLSNNQLTEIPPEIGNLTTLKYLNLSNNQLAEIPPQIGMLTALKRLNLSNNQLKKLPLKIGLLTDLEQLHLSNNQLTEIPPEIGKLTTLEYLNLSNNQLAEIPPEIGDLTALNILYLSDNQLKKLPLKIGQLKNLKILKLRGNQDLQGQEAAIRKMLPQVDIQF